MRASKKSVLDPSMILDPSMFTKAMGLNSRFAQHRMTRRRLSSFSNNIADQIKNKNNKNKVGDSQSSCNSR